MSLVIIEHLNMTEVCKMTFLNHLLVLHLTSLVFCSPSPSYHYGRAQKAKHYAGVGGSSYYPSKVLASASHSYSSASSSSSSASHPTESDNKYDTAGRHSSGRKQHNIDNIAGSSVYSIPDSLPMSEEYLEQITPINR